MYLAHSNSRRRLLSPTPHPLFVFFPLTLDIPEPLSSLSLTTNTTVQPQESIWIAFSQHLFALARVLALAVPSGAGKLAGPFGVPD